MTSVHYVDYIHPYPEDGGCVTVLELARELKASNHRPVLATSNLSGGGHPQRYEERITDQGVPLVLTPDGTIGTAVAADTHLVVAHHESGFEPARRLATEKGVPLLSCIWVDYKDLCSVAERLKIPASDIISRHTPTEAVELHDRRILESDAVLLPCRNTRAWDAVGDMKKFVVPPPTDAPTLPFVNKRSARKIAIGGRLYDPFKGMDRLLATFENLLEQDVEFELVVIGTPSEPLLADLKACIPDDRLQHVPWVKDRNEYFDVLKSADIFLSLSYWESYGLMLGEAIDLGLFPLTTDVALALDLVEEDAKLDQICISNQLEREDVAQEAAAKLKRALVDIDYFNDMRRRASAAYLKHRNGAMSITEVVENCIAEATDLSVASV